MVGSGFGEGSWVLVFCVFISRFLIGVFFGLGGGFGFFVYFIFVGRLVLGWVIYRNRVSFGG